ncbi:glycosyltransferase family 4 protein [Mameliella alba]|uniref:glycosyltransferase family 4 protein n=1 Tax=Mameliella alba TaxID=561184 RepID=UPI000B5354C2|nr:glycosyltransferase family 4 protein [Mameliella alba]MBY6117570.1 glycosyltransferase family 4 protein [Mameliella alba]OWV64964.1 hypothetical protein CDZ97_08800 [Mameliella alba]
MIETGIPTSNDLRVAVLQNHVPHYRIAFFDSIAATPGIDLNVHAARVTPRADGSDPDWFRRLGETRSVAKGIDWQEGATALDLSSVDVLVLSATIRTASNLVLARRARKRGIPVIWWGHYHSAGSRGLAKGLRRIMYRLGAAVLFYTDDEAGQYGADGGTLPASALNNGIDTREIVALRAPYDAATRPRRAMFIGRLTEKSRFDLLLQALARPEAASVELSVIGDAPDAIRARAETLGCADRVLWHGPRFIEAEIAPIANDARVFVYPGAVGLSLVHAMAYGLPVMVHDSRADHMPEIAAFAAGTTGVTFAREDVTDLARQLAALTDDPERLKAYSRAALDTVATRFNTQAMAARFCDWVRATAGAQQTGGPA